jgi:shikimate dehydrogenase
VSVYEAKDRALLRAISGADLIVNATPIGMSPADGAPLPSGSDLHSCAVVIDLVYGRTTELVALARRAGCRVSDGLEMLVQQGAEAFRLWTGVEPSHDVMRRACVAAIGETARC